MIHVLHLPENNSGRDFVIGDLHGFRSKLEELLVRVSFDESRDRLFSVGDLADRGPESMRSLSLLDEPWFYAVRGNHEEMLLDYCDTIAGNGLSELDKRLNASMFLQNGGTWAQKEIIDNVPTQELQQILNMLKALPYVLSVGDGDARFNVVHAEMYTSQRIYTDEDIDNGFSGADIEDLLSHMTTGRHLFNNTLLYNGMREGLSITYCGHTILESPLLAASHYGIDTGACLLDIGNNQGRWKLTMVETKTGEVHQCG